MTTEKSLENRVRSKARRFGMRLVRARGRTNINNLGGYRLIDSYRNYVLEGVDFDLTLEDAERRVEYHGQRG